MSTKSTIAHGETFHFYHECLDEDHVYLEIETTQFEAGYGRVMVPIPIHIWEVIRRLGAARLDLADRTDEELRAEVEAEVDRRVAEYRDAIRKDERGAAWVSLCGSLLYGGADDPREEQVARGLEYFTAERRRQREVVAAVEKLKANLRRDEVVLIDLDERRIAGDLLITLMRQASQDNWSAAWHPGVEYLLWEAAIGENEKLRGPGLQARYLSEKCQGWAVWDKALGRPRLTAMRGWVALYYEHRRREEGRRK